MQDPAVCWWWWGGGREGGSEEDLHEIPGGVLAPPCLVDKGAVKLRAVGLNPEQFGCCLEVWVGGDLKFLSLPTALHMLGDGRGYRKISVMCSC